MNRTSIARAASGAVLAVAVVLGFASTASAAPADVIPVGTNPAQVVVSPDGTRAYVGNVTAPDSVYVIDTATKGVIATIPVDSDPYSLDVTPDGAFVYVASYGSGTVSVIDTTTNTVVDTIDVGTGSQPVNLQVAPDGAFAYVVTSLGFTLVGIDTATNTVTRTVALDADATAPSSRPSDLVITPDSTTAYVGLWNADLEVAVVDLATEAVTDRIPVADTPSNVFITRDGSEVWTITGSTSTTVISIIDTATNTVSRTLPAGTRTVAIDFSLDGSRAYFTSTSINDIRTYSTTSLTRIGTADVGSSPFGLEVAPNGDVYSAMIYGNSVWVLSPPTIAGATLAAGNVGDPYADDVAASTGTDPVTYVATGLPAGLTMATDGAITGTPTEGGTFSVTVTATNAVHEASDVFALEVTGAAVVDAGVDGDGDVLPDTGGFNAARATASAVFLVCGAALIIATRRRKARA